MAKKYSYITQMEDKYGEYWVSNVKPEDIQKQTKRIVRDIVYGNIMYDEVGKYFLDYKFLENLIIGIRNELEINTLNYNACCFQFQYFNDIPNMGNHITRLSKVIFIYSTILERLEYVKSTGNIGFMVDLSATLYVHRNNLN